MVQPFVRNTTIYSLLYCLCYIIYNFVSMSFSLLQLLCFQLISETEGGIDIRDLDVRPDRSVNARKQEEDNNSC